MAHQTEPNISLANITGQKVYTEPPRHEWTCKNCKFWERRGDMIIGLCQKVVTSPVDNFSDKIINAEITIYKWQNGEYNFGMGENFGCINFEGK